MPIWRSPIGKELFDILCSGINVDPYDGQDRLSSHIQLVITSLNSWLICLLTPATIHPGQKKNPFLYWNRDQDHLHSTLEQLENSTCCPLNYATSSNKSYVKKCNTITLLTNILEPVLHGVSISYQSVNHCHQNKQVIGNAVV